MKEIELLAPAKDLECGIAAIDHGADAVYIGAPRFGAREAAGNSLADIAELAAYAHKYWARVYVTVNTLLRDEEIQPALELIHRLYEAGIDGLIIQDAGLLECDLPPIPLIASTQMHNNTPGKIAFLERVGIKRVILARELTLDEIRGIRRATSVELESFVHGALCVCYSGQCYLSYALGGRSSNRGQCAQPCRKRYTLVGADGKPVVSGKHLLSLKDLNLSDHLRDLIDAGVCSFKIEGRLKDRAYVSNVVAFYRAKLDEVLPTLGLKKSSSGTSRIDLTPDLDKTFNRGYTTYFLNGRGEPIGSIDTPKMVGEPVGKVVEVTRRGVRLEGGPPLHPGDGICFFDRAGELRGTVVNGAQGDLFVPDKLDGIEKDALIYRNHDHEFLSRVNKSQSERRIDVALTLRETRDGLLLIAVDEDGNRAESEMPIDKVPADKPDQAMENASKQLAKTGGTDFRCAGVELELSQAWFLPISALNALRREVLQKLARVREGNRPIQTGGPIRNDAPYPQKSLSFEGNVLNRKARAFYERHGVTSIEPAAESGLDLRGRRVMTTRYCIKHQLGTCPRHGRADRTGPLRLVDEDGRAYDLRFDCEECVMEVWLPKRTNRMQG